MWSFPQLNLLFKIMLNYTIICKKKCDRVRCNISDSLYYYKTQFLFEHVWTDLLFLQIILLSDQCKTTYTTIAAKYNKNCDKKAKLGMFHAILFPAIGFLPLFPQLNVYMIHGLWSGKSPDLFILPDQTGHRMFYGFGQMGRNELVHMWQLHGSVLDRNYHSVRI